MTRVAIHGAAGRMGRTLLAACRDHDRIEMAGAIEHAGHPDLGRDIGELTGSPVTGITLTADPASVDCDVVIDFSQPAATLELIEACAARDRGAVIGTTGFDGAQRAELERYAAMMPVVLAPNMGIGINLLFGLVEAAARSLGEDYDAEVCESHHRYKVDAPSGTALHLGECIASGRGRSLDECQVPARHGQTGERRRGDIGFAVVRGGDIVGEHSVLFAGDGERVEITHKASSRQVFAAGAIRAAAWIHGRPPGLYDMQDVLNLTPA